MARFTSLLVLAAMAVGSINAASFDHRTLAARSDHAALAKRVAAPTKLKKRCPAKASKASLTAAAATSPEPDSAAPSPAPVVNTQPSSNSVTATVVPSLSTVPLPIGSPPPPPPVSTSTSTSVSHPPTSTSVPHSSSSAPHPHPTSPKPDSSSTSSSSAAPTTHSTAPAEPPVTTHKPTSTTVSSTKKPTSSSTKKPTATPAPPPAKPPPPSGKVGLSWTDGFPNALSSWTKGAHIGGAYNWGPNRPQSVHDAGIPFFPMLWGDRNVGVWLDTVVKGYGTLAFGCNEVNQPGQSQMDPGHGATLWRQQMMPLISRGYRLGSHSVSNAPSGKTWFQQFFSQCPECRNTTDYMQAHYYGTDPDNFISYITDLHDTFGIPIIVTEWACQDFSGQNNQCSMSQVQDFLAKTTAFMNKTSWVAMYFWFGLFNPMSGGVNPDNGLMDGSGHPNALGRQYIGL